MCRQIGLGASDYKKLLEARQEKGPYISIPSFLDGLESEYAYGTNTDGQEWVYFGHLLNKKRDGAGITIFQDESMYEGYYKNDEMHGKGRLILSDGTCTQGEWSNDKVKGESLY